MDRPTFSPFWHRVRALRPRLRAHVQVNRQRYRGRVWHVVQDPASNQFYRLNPVAYDLVSMLDGRRTVDEAWQITLGKFGDAAPTQNEVIQLISQLFNANLLSVDLSPETEQLLHRGAERRKKKAIQQVIGIMYLRMRMFNPDRIISALEPLFRPVINRWGFFAWIAFMLFVLYQLVSRSTWSELAGGFDSLIENPANWGWIAVVFIVTKAWHELGHGVICKRYGGQVPEFGFMLLVLFPAPYVDATSCWAFADKRKRMAVGAGGMLFELFIAGLATLIWLDAPAGSFTRQLMYNVMLTASISTILFNANPLLKFDGYYILSDALEVPNMAQRSNNMLKHFFKKYYYRLERQTPPTTMPGERAILYTYGVLALAYRVFLFITITLFVMGKLFALGLVLAIWTASAWFLMPVGQFVHWLAAKPELHDKRGRTIGLSVAGIGACFLLLGALPLPDHRGGRGVVESVSDTGVYAGTDGFLVEVLRRPGEVVAAGDAVARLENPDLDERAEMLRLSIAEMRLREREALRAGQPAAAEIVGDNIAVQQAALDEVVRRLDALTVRADYDGVLVGQDPSRLLGAYVRRGDLLSGIVNPTDLRVAAVVEQRQAAWLFDRDGEPDVRVRLRPRSDAGLVVEVPDWSPIETAQRRVPHSSLTYMGGGDVEPDQRDESGRAARRGQFTLLGRMDVPEGSAWIPTPGERVELRFTLRDKPLLGQWYARLRQAIQGRVDV